MMVYYWNEPVRVGSEDWNLFLAASAQGLIMGGLGNQEEHQSHLFSLVKRYFPGYNLKEKREPLKDIIREFQEYFRRERRVFSFPLHQVGTEFQLKVWQALLDIPYGQTKSYSEIAEQVGCPKGQRAVGMANNKNPLGIVVPCHRVIGKNGSLVGYAGGLEIKKLLLELESGKDG